MCCSFVVLLVCMGLDLKGDRLLENSLVGLLLYPAFCFAPRVGVRLPLCMSLLWFEEVIREFIIFGFVCLIC